MKGCICHFEKWQIHPFISKGTKYSILMVFKYNNIMTGGDSLIYRHVEDCHCQFVKGRPLWSAKYSKGSICLLIKWADTTFWLCTSRLWWIVLICHIANTIYNIFEFRPTSCLVFVNVAVDLKSTKPFKCLGSPALVLNEHWIFSKRKRHNVDWAGALG